MLVFAAIVPHPPFSVPGVGTAEEKNGIKRTLESFVELREGLEKVNPDTIVIISPHGRMERYNFTINADPFLRGSMIDYGLDKIFEFKNDMEMVNRIVYACGVNEMIIHLHSYFLDHGVLVPLMHLLKNINPEVVDMSFSLLGYEKHFMYGEMISNVINKTDKRIAVIASGDLSHCLTPDAPAGYNPRSKFFDQRVIEYLANDDVGSLMGMKKEAIKASRECGIRSILILMGIIHGKNYKFNFLSYEGPYGIGYLTARFL